MARTSASVSSVWLNWSERNAKKWASELIVRAISLKDFKD
jgi:hypothetical protein